MKKKLFLSMLMSCFGLVGFANTWSVLPITIAPGETVKVDFSLESTTPDIRMFTFVFKLPEDVSVAGFTEDATQTLKGTSENIITTSRLSGLEDKLSVAYRATGASAGTYKATGNLGSGNQLDGTSGVVFSLKLVAKSTAAETSGVITISDTKIADQANTAQSVTFSNPEVTISNSVKVTFSNDWNTFCSAHSLDFSSISGVTVYGVSTISAKSVDLTEVDKVPAEEGVLVKGSGTFNVPILVTAPSSTGSKLVGVTAATEIDADNFILSGDKFIKCVKGVLPAGKCYIKGGDVPASAKEFLMIEDDAVVTGINEVQAENSVNGPIYNVNGARVSNPQKGVYIMNGRKVIVK